MESREIKLLLAVHLFLKQLHPEHKQIEIDCVGITQLVSLSIPSLPHIPLSNFSSNNLSIWVSE